MKQCFSKSQLLRMAEALYEDSQDKWDRQVAKRLGKVGRKLLVGNVLREENIKHQAIENRYLNSRFKNTYRIKRRRK